MSDFPTPSDRDDELLRHALATLDRAATPQIRPPGSDAARARARQRRRRHRLAAGAVAALVAIPLAVNAASIGFPPWPPAPANRTTGSSGVLPAGSGPADIMTGTTVPIDWSWVQSPESCASGEMTVGSGSSPDGRTYVGSWAATDVGGDGELDVLLEFICRGTDERLVAQMIALFSQKAPPTAESPGSYRLAGTVVRFEPKTTTEAIGQFWVIGRERLLVQIVEAGCCEGPALVTTQWQSYSLTDPDFPQIPAPAPFDGDATLKFEVDYPAPVEFGPADDAGRRTGEFILTLVNRSSRPANVKVQLRYVDVGRGSFYAKPPGEDPACDGTICTLDLGSIPSGGSATRTLQLTVPQAAMPPEHVPVASLWVQTTNQDGTFDAGYFLIKAADR